LGDRGQVNIIDKYGQDIWLYTHWGATELIDKVRKALTRSKPNNNENKYDYHGRWGDTEYLARIIFCEMVRDNIDGTSGYGIGSTGAHGDEWRIITIDVSKQLVTVKDNDKVKLEQSFKEFIVIEEL